MHKYRLLVALACICSTLQAMREVPTLQELAVLKIINQDIELKDLPDYFDPQQLSLPINKVLVSAIMRKFNSQLNSLFVKTLEGHTGEIVSVALSDDASSIVTGSSDRTVKVWSLKTGQLLSSLNHDDRVRSVAISGNGKYIVIGCDNYSYAEVWDRESEQLVYTLHGHRGRISSVAISTCGRYVVTGSYDGTAKVWDISTRSLLHTLTGHTNAVLSVAVSQDGKYIITGSWDKTAKVWDGHTGELLCTIVGYAGSSTSVAISHDGRYIAACCCDKAARVWNRQTGQLLHTFTCTTCTVNGMADTVRSVAISKNSKYVVTIFDSKIVVWNTQTGKPVYTLTGNANLIDSVAISKDGSSIVTSLHEKVMVWNIQSLLKKDTIGLTSLLEIIKQQ